MLSVGMLIVNLSGGDLNYINLLEMPCERQIEFI